MNTTVDPVPALATGYGAPPYDERLYRPVKYFNFLNAPASGTPIDTYNKMEVDAKFIALNLQYEKFTQKVEEKINFYIHNLNMAMNDAYSIRQRLEEFIRGDAEETDWTLFTEPPVDKEEEPAMEEIIVVDNPPVEDGTVVDKPTNEPEIPV